MKHSRHNSIRPCSLAFFILFLITIVSTVLADDSKDAALVSPGLYRYQTETGSRESFFIWEKSQENRDVVITVNDHDNNRLMINRCRENGETISWMVKENGNTEIRAERIDDTLHIYGTKEGRYIDETYTIDSKPWYQPLSFSLTKFLFSENESVVFWSIRQDTIDLTSIEAKKIGLETVVINSQEIPAVKVEIRVVGFLSSFWHGTYWYRQENGQFLKYIAVTGPPGSAETVISLVGKLSS